MRIVSSLLLILFVAGFSRAQNKSIEQRKLTNFQLQSTELISDPGQVISTTHYKSNVYWFPVQVPSTVLTGLVANNVYPDPYSGMNNMYIPDASDKFNKEYDLEKFSHIPNVGNPWKKPYWYRTTFTIPAKDKGRHTELIFKGINYRADVWLNGQQVADSSQMVGMFAQYRLNVSDKIKAGEKNVLAVKIYPLDYPGLPDTEQLKAFGDFFLNGGPTGDIGKNVTMMCSVGWDWMPPVRDRNMGIWQPVYLRTSGDVTITNPHIITELPNLPDISKANLSVNLTLSNFGSQSAKGTLKLNIQPENFRGSAIQISKDVMVKASGSTEVNLNAKNTPQLALNNPKLWWPNSYGKANLYRMHFQFENNGEVTDDTTFVFGVRTVSSKATEVPGKFLRRDFYVNGKRIQLTGGAWVPDMMLNRDSLRFDNELKLCKNANINLVRIWGGGITPPDVFFDAADRYGLLIWSDFWVTGDTHGEFKGSTDWPLQGDVFVKNVVSTILRIRNHPSLLLWTGGNEGHIRKDVYDRMRESVINLDGTRPFIPSSSGFAKLPKGWKGSWPDNKASGVYSGGPYTWQEPKEYYRRADDAKDWVFKDETGLPSQPTYNSLPKVIPDLVWDTTLPFPLNNTWGYHDAATGNGKYDQYYYSMVDRYGEPKSMEDFSNKMQLMNATGYQGTFEAAGHKLNDIGGIMLWKLNAAFPSVVWQVYDWFMQPNAGYYFMQNACEPVHIQLNTRDFSVATLNRTYHPVSGLTAEVQILGMDSKQEFHKTAKVNLKESDVQDLFSLSDELAHANEVKFVLLNLKDSSGKVISRNSYWLAANNDFKAMNNMAQTNVETTVLNKETNATDTQWTVKVSNNSQKLAFFIRPQLMQDGEEVLPTFWSAGYFSLAPGESTTIRVSVASEQIENGQPEIQISGWNVNRQQVSLK